MIASTPLPLLLLFSVLLSVTAQVPIGQGLRPSITCYTKYQHEETRDSDLNTVINYAYSQSEITHSQTLDGEYCSQVGCACYSYRSACASAPTSGNYFSPCTPEDQQNRAVKWHRGLTSHAKCEQMQQRSDIYQNLTCCYTDRCNDQPGKVTQSVQSRLPLQRYESHFRPTASSPAPVSYPPTRRYENAPRVSVTPLVMSERPREVYEQSTSLNGSPSMNYASNWMKVLVFGLILMI